MIKTFIKTLCFIGVIVMSATAALAKAPRIYMITIHTVNYEEMKNFYENVMDMKIASESEEFTEFSTEGIRLSLVSHKMLSSFLASKNLGQRGKGSGVGIGFRYDSRNEVDGAFMDLKKKGVIVVAEPTLQPWGEYTAFFEDPDGNIHELVFYEDSK